MNRFSSFLLWLSKTNPTYFKMCPKHVQWQRTALALFILCTWTLAFITGCYFVKSIFLNYDDGTGTMYVSFLGWVASIIFGLFWASFIAMTDRESISAGSKFAIVCRLVLAVLIGYVISIPLEMQIFSDRIMKELTISAHEVNGGFMEKRNASIQRYDNRIADIESQIKVERANKNKWSETAHAEEVGREGTTYTGRAGRGSCYTSAQNNYFKSKEQEERLVKELEDAKREKEIAVREADAQYEDSIVDQSYGFFSQYEALEDLKTINPRVRFFTTMITLLLVILEAVPCLMRILQQEDEYDILLKASSRINISYLTAIANLRIFEIENDKNINNQASSQHASKKLLEKVDKKME
ncbi:MAG: DUF4407 domain-containing protein [Candidatus Cloacimonetes bacterium]|jgi:hypothetical protein|nr:DUF4407 domain-containing protein [Candidatus Cloacimonadota bacterium]